MIQILSKHFGFAAGRQPVRPHTMRAVLFCAVVSLASMGFAGHVFAEDSFTIQHAEVNLVNKVYQLSADMEYKLNDNVRDAIDSGVPLIMVMDIELYRPRKYLWNKDVADLQQRYKLQYHALAEQYIVTNLNSGAQHTFHSLSAAIGSLRSLHDIPVIDAQLLDPTITYNMRLRVRLELSSLPVPLRLIAYLNSKWRKLSSEWYSLSLTGEADNNVAQDNSR